MLQDFFFEEPPTEKKVPGTVSPSLKASPCHLPIPGEYPKHSMCGIVTYKKVMVFMHIHVYTQVVQSDGLGIEASFKTAHRIPIDLRPGILTWNLKN